jgi:hypothetical protein
MIDPASQAQLKAEIASCIQADKRVLEDLRAEVRPLRSQTRKIQARSTTSISLVGTDGGNNQLQFDPFLIQLVRVVDSSNNEYCLEAVSPTTPIQELSRRQFTAVNTPATALGHLMRAVGAGTLQQLSHMIRPAASGAPVSPSWVQVYREIVEWAILFSILEKDFGTDTLIICDGLLRSKVFAGDRFQRLIQEMNKRIESQWIRNRRRIYLAGVAKHSKVLTRYRLAMALEGVMQTDHPSCIEVPREMEEKAYIWSEFARGDDRTTDSGEINKFVGGKMFLVKFGSGSRDPIWPVDIFVPQKDQASVILGCMLADAVEGFPVPCYPRCLQKAHENAALVDFDFDILQDHIYQGVRDTLGSHAKTLDAFQLQDADPSQRRYS